MILDLRQAAARLGVSSETVRRWARQGVLGMRMPGGDLRFEEEELKSWALSQGLKLREETRPCWPLAVDAGERPLTAAMRRGGIYPFFDGDDPEQVLAELVKMSPINNEVTRSKLLEQLIAREALSSTGLGHGIALPHPRTPSSELVEDPTVMVALLNNPIDWAAIDGEEVSAVFLLLNPDPQRHLQILSRVSYMLRDNDFTNSLRHNADPESILELVALREPACT